MAPDNRMSAITSIANLSRVEQPNPSSSMPAPVSDANYVHRLITQQLQIQLMMHGHNNSLQQQHQEFRHQFHYQPSPSTPSPVQNLSGTTNNHLTITDLLNNSGNSTSGITTNSTTTTPTNGHHRPHHNGSRKSSLASASVSTSTSTPSSTSSTTTTTTTSNRNNRHARNTNQDSKKELIDLVTCKLCKGYLIDAATIDLCMHTFCRPCAVKYIRDHQMCPECETQIKDKRFLNRLKSDSTMQNIVYKLVPGLYENEMARRREFYAARPTPTPRYKSEMFGDIPPCKTIRPDDMLNISITWDRDGQEDDSIKTYFLCRADSTIGVFKKLIIKRFGLDWPIKIYYGNSEVYSDLTTLIDVAVTFNWSPESKVLNLNFKEEQPREDDKDDNKSSQTTSHQVNSSPPVNFGLGPSSDP